MQILKKTTFAAAGLLLVLFSAPLSLQAQEGDTYRHLKLFGEVFERVRADFVEEVSDEELIEAAIRGMLTDLDPHSGYLDPDNFREMRTQTRGEFGGLGIEVTMEKGYVKVVSPIDDTPAFRAGIQPGDLITHLDGDPVQGLTLAEAVEKMRGPVDTSLRLTIRREDQPPFDVEVTRDVIRIQSVRWRREGDLGYIRITSFSEQTEEGLKEAVDELQKEIGDDLKPDYVIPGPFDDRVAPAQAVLLDLAERDVHVGDAGEGGGGECRNPSGRRDAFDRGGDHADSGAHRRRDRAEDSAAAALQCAEVHGAGGGAHLRPAGAAGPGAGHPMPDGPSATRRSSAPTPKTPLGLRVTRPWRVSTAGAW